MATRDEFVESIKKKLDEWNAEIEKAEARFQHAAADARLRHAEEIAEMKRRRTDAEEQMRKAAAKTAEDWEAGRKQFESALDDISDGFRRAWSRFF